MFYVFFLFIVGLFNGGLSFEYWFVFLSMLPNILLILCIPLIIDMQKNFENIKILRYLLTFILFFIQLYEIIFRTSLFPGGQFYLRPDEGLQRNVSGIYFVFFTLIIALSDYFSSQVKLNFLPLQRNIFY